MTEPNKSRNVINIVQIIIGIVVTLLIPFQVWVIQSIYRHEQSLALLNEHVRVQVSTALPDRVTALEQTQLNVEDVNKLRESIHELQIQLIRLEGRLEGGERR